MFDLLGQLVAAYFVADVIGSLYHYATDRGWNTRRIVAQFMNHHDAPETITFDLEPMLGGLPIIALGAWLGSLFVIATGVFVGLIQVPHYYVHHPAPRWVRVLQAWGVFISPEQHAEHHTRLDRSFSVFNGWSNPLLNWCLIKKRF